MSCSPGGRSFMSSSSSAFEQEIEAYKKFKSTRLLPEMEALLHALSDLKAEASDFERLGVKSQELSLSADSSIGAPISITLQLGSNFTADFDVFDRDFVLVSVGFGFFCQMTWSEAASFSGKKVSLLARKQQLLTQKLAKLEEHLKLTSDIIEELTRTIAANKK